MEDKYKITSAWIDDVIKATGIKISKNNTSSFNYIQSSGGQYGLFIDTNTTTLDKYLDGASLKAQYSTFRIFLPFSQANGAASVNTNAGALNALKDIMEKLEEIELTGATPGYPDFGENAIVQEIELLDNDPKIEIIEENNTIACYSFQFSIIYLDKQFINIL